MEMQAKQKKNRGRKNRVFLCKKRKGDAGDRNTTGLRKGKLRGVGGEGERVILTERKKKR